MLAAYGGQPVYHEDEDFEPDRRHRREFSASVGALCQAVRHVPLGQGYLVARQYEQVQSAKFNSILARLLDLLAYGNTINLNPK